MYFGGRRVREGEGNEQEADNTSQMRRYASAGLTAALWETGNGRENQAPPRANLLEVDFL